MARGHVKTVKALAFCNLINPLEIALSQQVLSDEHETGIKTLLLSCQKPSLMILTYSLLPPLYFSSFCRVAAAKVKICCENISVAHTPRIHYTYFPTPCYGISMRTIQSWNRPSPDAKSDLDYPGYASRPVRWYHCPNCLIRAFKTSRGSWV